MPSKHQVTALLLAKAWEGRRASTEHDHALDANPKRAHVVHYIEHVLVLDDANPPTPGQPRCRSTHVLPGYGHLDVFLGKDAHHDVFPMLLDELNTG